jgi:hypothetical protein
MSSEPPADWLPPLTRRVGVSSGEGVVPQSEVSAAVSNEVKLSYETHPLDPDDYSPFANKLTQRPRFSEGQFSTWVSNRDVLKLNR